MPDVMFYDNSMVVMLTGLQDRTGAYISDATVIATLTDAEGMTLLGWDGREMVPVDGDPGSYEAQVEPDLLLEKQKYNLHVVAEWTGLRFSARSSFRAQVRRA